MTTPVHLVVGPTRHGVVRWAGDIAEALGAPVVRADDPDEVRSGDLDGARAVHIHVTDRLFGPDAMTAAQRFVAVVDVISIRVLA